MRTPDGDFQSGGAVVTCQKITAYPKSDGVLGDWHGNPIGTWRSVSNWKQHGLIIHQIEATIEGRTYTGRGQGVGMVYNGKRKLTK